MSIFVGDVEEVGSVVGVDEVNPVEAVSSSNISRFCEPSFMLTNHTDPLT